MACHNKILISLGLVLLLMPSPSFGQRSIGIAWNPPSSQQKVQKQLHRFSKAGFSYLLIEAPLNNQTWETINRLGFKVYAGLPVRFPISTTFRRADSTWYQQIRKIAAEYQEQPSVKAIGLFSYGPTASKAFQKEASVYIKKVESVSSKKFYFLTSSAQPTPFGNLIDFKILRAGKPYNSKNSKVKALLYHPSDGKTWMLAPVKQFLEATANSPNIPIFFNSSWLRTMTNKHPHFWNILSHYATSSDAIFPLPQHKKPVSESNNVIVIALLIAWALLGVTFRYDPLYRRSLHRYFSAHHFYAGDVMSHNIRTVFSGYSILIQHCIAGGIIYFCALQTALSELGQQAFFGYLPVLSAFGTGEAGLFLWGLIATLIIEIFSILFLFLTNSGISHPGQAINLYCWPLQLNIFIATIAVIFFFTGSGPIPIYLLGSAFLLILFSSFAITAKDMMSYLTGGAQWIFSITSALYILIIFGFIVWLFLYSEFPKIIRLATFLS